ncbi:MAG: hypothetical protein H0X25_08195 [Acidobacteriales bacterium]|nr:hypothetical protein [Terriglobales bacterium]
MPPTLNGTAEPGQPRAPEEITISLVVPEEFVGVSMTELQSRQGLVADMKVKDGIVSIRATLPKAEYGELKNTVRRATLGRGRVETAPSP